MTATNGKKSAGKTQNCSLEVRRFDSGNEHITLKSGSVRAMIIVHTDGTMSFDIHPDDSYTNVSVYETDKIMPQFHRVQHVSKDNDNLVFQTVQIEGKNK